VTANRLGQFGKVKLFELAATKCEGSRKDTVRREQWREDRQGAG
jgi:hypothetical protein